MHAHSAALTKPGACGTCLHPSASNFKLEALITLMAAKACYHAEQDKKGQASGLLLLLQSYLSSEPSS